jgi:hypothetical protein
LTSGKLVSVPAAEEKRQTGSQQSDDAAESHIFSLCAKQERENRQQVEGRKGNLNPII